MSVQKFNPALVLWIFQKKYIKKEDWNAIELNPSGTIVRVDHILYPSYRWFYGTV